MQHSTLIFGKNKEKRKQEALALAQTYSSPADTYILDTEEDSTIGSVRNILETLTRKPFESEKTSLVIFEVQNLSIEAQNLFLKPLEEPKETNLIILTAPTPFAVLPTIDSRCHKRDLGTSLETETEEFSNLSTKLTLAEKIKLGEELDLESWESFWRKKLLENLNSESRLKIVSYLRQIQKTREFIQKRANPKLAKINLLLSLPQVEN